MADLRRILLVFCMFFGWLSHGQNLVVNPSFETYVDCPRTLGNLDDDVMQWRTPTLGSTDYFNTCSKAMGAPKNFNGEQHPEFGDAYVGLYLFAPDDYREYIMGQLREPLQKGIAYKISFQISLAERSDFAVQTFGVLFSDTPFAVETRKTLSGMHLTKVGQKSSAVLEIEMDDFYSNQEEWVEVVAEYEAIGGERFVTIGNFKDNRRTKKLNFRGNLTQGAYYYLDMVEVAMAGKSIQNKRKEHVGVHGETQNGQVAINTTTLFENVVFAFDDIALTEEAKDEIKGIFSQLETNPNWYIVISGHTDTVGSAAYNQRLSEKRALAVAQYLVELGLENARVKWQGYGSTRPLTESPVQDLQGKNRRVEFTITQSPNNQNRP